ncbi:NAD(P)H-dependent oxidoreductase [Fusobacterium gastrosuis]|uniref:NAD(P)H-dependent oxidoreductase n=2 Tax=Fusobacterium TaxID=848 RepID=UPI00297521B3|nr:NAD(P)H-dependent oxidoreductase [Fusobacteriaceae bacterium]MDY5713748.1 NAD(P)H-dependent oxidoreductase [Fusobacterium gastrosuis]
MKKILVILAHPNIGQSVGNKSWKEEAEKNPNVIVHNIYEAYPDGNVDVEKELKLLKETGTLILQFPMHWFNCPPLLKTWIDNVFMAAHYSDGEKILANKKIGLAVTTGGVKERYDGSYGVKFEDVLAPFRLSVNHLNAINLPIHSLHGVMPGQIKEEEVLKSSKEYGEYLKNNI